LDIISFSAANPNYLVDNPDYMGFTYALYLLAQFKEKQAYPIIVKYVSQLTNGLDGTGDMVTEDLGSLLASVCNGDLSLIKQLIENPERNGYVRSAALESLEQNISITTPLPTPWRPKKYNRYGCSTIQIAIVVNDFGSTISI